MSLLIPLGLIGMQRHILPIFTAILTLLVILYFSYRQTITAYPNGGGSYTVASENLGDAAGLLAASPAEAAFRVIKWDVTKICQIWDFSLGRPLPHHYRVMTGPKRSFGAALRAKDRLWHKGRCSI